MSHKEVLHPYSQTPLPLKVYTSTFFKWIICRENDENKWAKMLKEWNQCFFIDLPPKRVCFVHLV